MTARGPNSALALLAIVALMGACTNQRATFTPVASASAEPGASPSPGTSVTPAKSATPELTLPPTPTPEPAAFDPARVSITLQSIVKVPGRPLAIANAGDRSNRLFVADKEGQIFVIKAGKVVSTPLLDIRDQASAGGEQGLLGLAFHPDPTDGRLFVYYTNMAGNIVISSFEVEAGGDRVVSNSETVLLTIDHSRYGNHNGGGLLFGPDGYLYAATGDGGGGGDPFGSGQDKDTLLGKILRIDVDGGDPYAIPADNPFASTNGARGEIWLTGLRNPFRFSFDRSNGDLWIGDVGQNKWEEIDVARSAVGGLNFGWSVMEGAHCFRPATGCPQDGLTLPVAEYGHDFGVAVIGGYVYRGPQAILQGGYIYSDNYSGRIWALAAAGDGMKDLVQVGQGAVGVAGYGEAESGELYAADLDGTVYRVVGKPR